MPAIFAFFRISKQYMSCQYSDLIDCARLFRREKYTILVRDHRFFAASLSQMDLGNVDTKEAFVLVRLTMKYVIKSTDYFLPCVRFILKLTSLYGLHITHNDV